MKLEQIDLCFINRIQDELTQSCALPFKIPQNRIVDIIWQTAQWFWEKCDDAVEERWLFINNSEIRRVYNNKVIKLPFFVNSIHGCYKMFDGTTNGSVMGDFSIERMMMSSYNAFGGIGVGSTATGSSQYKLLDVVSTMYEISTFDSILNPPLSYNYNRYTNKLVLLGNLGNSNLVLQAYLKVHIRDLYNSYYFFRLCVCFAKRVLLSMYGGLDYKLPGGVSINFDHLTDSNNDEIEKIEEWCKNNYSIDYFYTSNSI